VADYPIDLPGDIVERFGHAFDVEERIPRALDALAPLADRDVLLLDSPPDGLRASQLRARRGRVAVVGEATVVEPAMADIVVGLWSTLDRPGTPSERAALDCVRPGGRILAIHDYGRDEVHALIDTPGGADESTSPERREVPFLAEGWKVRVIHCFWTFGSLDEARTFAGSFGGRGRTFAVALRRPRLSHNLAVFYRSVPTSS
jgi:hypothetical protein